MSGPSRSRRRRTAGRVKAGATVLALAALGAFLANRPPQPTVVARYYDIAVFRPVRLGPGELLVGFLIVVTVTIAIVLAAVHVSRRL